MPSAADAPASAGARGQVRLQPLTRARIDSLGPAGSEWLHALPGLLNELEELWSIELGHALPGGSSSYVVETTRADGTPAVLKVAIPDPGLADQVAVLRRAAGHGYAELLEYDASRSALLLERLGRTLYAAGIAPEEQLVRLADTLALAWLDPKDVPPADKAGGLAELIDRLWLEHDRPCSERVIMQAMRFAERRRADPGELVVVHGDPHPGNLLAAPRERGTGWCFVDPDGFVADRAYDLGVTLREWNAELTGPDAKAVAQRYCALLAGHTGVDATRIWEWGFVERVSTGLYVISIGSPEYGQRFLDSAERLVD